MTTVFIDEQRLQEAKDLMGARFPQMLQIYVDSVEQYVHDIIAEVENMHIEAISMNGHTIKSSSLQLGFMQVAETAIEIEKVDASMKKAEIQKLADKLSSQFDEAKAYINDLIAEAG